MSKVKIKLNRAGVRELLSSPEAGALVEEYANQVQNRANSSCPGYEVTTMVGRNRVNASVHAATVEARQDNYKNNTLLKALGGGV